MNVTLILQLIAAFPQALVEITALWSAIRTTFSNDDQVTIDKALADAQAGDATSTAAADASLDAASKK
jgi:hypothetical protein